MSFRPLERPGWGRGRALAGLQASNGNIVVTATSMLSDGLLVFLQLEADARLEGKSCFCILFPGLPGKAEGGTGEPCFSLQSCESPLGNCQQTPLEHLRTLFGCLDYGVRSSASWGLTCVNGH